MKRNYIFIKKVLPAILVSAVASTVYFGIAKADVDERTIYIEAVDDIIEVGAGYYEESVYVKTALETPSTFTGNAYTAGANETVTGSPLSQAETLNLEDYKNGKNYSIDVGVDEQITLAPGYYYGNVNIKNGVKDRGEIEGVLDGNMQGVYFEPGYYKGGQVLLNPSFNAMRDKIATIFGLPLNENSTFEDITNSLEGSSFALNNTGTANYLQRLAGENLSLGTSETNPEVRGIALAGQELYIGVDEKLTIPAGYYNEDISITNGIVDRQSGSAVLDGNAQSTTLPAGYYNDSTISINTTFANLKDRISAIFGIDIPEDATFMDIVAALTGDKFTLNRKGTATYTEKRSGTNERLGTSSTNNTVTNIDLSGQTLQLGVEESITIPAGYYNEDITITNGVVHQESVDTKVSADNNDTYGSKSVVYGPGYYDSIKVTDNTSTGAITVRKSNGTTKTWDASTQSWN